MTKTYLQITLKVSEGNRAAAGAVYAKYKAPFLANVDGAESKELLIRDEDVQVLHGFGTPTQAAAYLNSELFSRDVVGELSQLLDGSPEVRIYSVVG